MSYRYEYGDNGCVPGAGGRDGCDLDTVVPGRQVAQRVAVAVVFVIIHGDAALKSHVLALRRNT